MMLYATTKDGFPVHIPKKHMKLHEADLPAVIEALANIQANGEQFIKTCFDFGRQIGTTICVKTTADDEIVFASRVGRTTKTRFVLNRKPEPCSTVTIIMARNNEGYRLITGYVGGLAEREVDDPSISSSEEFKRCLKFWSEHALCFEYVPIKAGEQVTKATLKEFA